jgi:two-component system, NtrC family, response regulator AlgB
LVKGNAVTGLTPELAQSSPELGLRVLVVQRNSRVRTTLVLCLERLGCAVLAVDTAEAALNAVEHLTYELAFIDPRVGPETGQSLETRLVVEVPGLAVVILAACSNLHPILPSISQSACGHLSESFTPGQVRQIVDGASELRKLRLQLADLESRLAYVTPESKIVAESQAMRRVMDVLQCAAPSDAQVLLHGESGTGKGVLARFLHAHSSRAKGPFVAAKCMGPSTEGVESEIFGNAYGLRMSSLSVQQGRIEAAEGGTLFLEEIGELSLTVQARLLRLLQEKTFERVGEARTRRVDVRIVATTTCDLEEAVRKGTFREDLFYLLNATDIEVPPLRRRGEDIVPLARTFLQTFARKSREKLPELTQTAQQALTNYGWPGNVRELRNLIERAVMLCGTGVIDATNFPPCMTTSYISTPQLGGNFSLKEIEREHIRRVAGRVSSTSEAAQILGISTQTLWRRRREDTDHP